MTYRQLAGLLRDARIRAGLTQKDVAEAVKVSRETIHSLETARPKRPVDADLANNLARVLPGVTVLDIVTAMGYRVTFEGVQDEGEAALLEAYRLASDAERRIVRLALDVEPPRPRDEVGRSFRR